MLGQPMIEHELPRFTPTVPEPRKGPIDWGTVGVCAFLLAFLIFIVYASISTVRQNGREARWERVICAQVGKSDPAPVFAALRHLDRGPFAAAANAYAIDLQQYGTGSLVTQSAADRLDRECAS